MPLEILLRIKPTDSALACNILWIEYWLWWLLIGVRGNDLLTPTVRMFRLPFVVLRWAWKWKSELFVLVWIWKHFGIAKLANVISIPRLELVVWNFYSGDLRLAWTDWGLLLPPTSPRNTRLHAQTVQYCWLVFHVPVLHCATEGMFTLVLGVVFAM